ncbi:MAG TPA: DHH family phosphoesterase [Verrucomicrobiae bacterium]|nr:DHH family phosphoesterase [Verrucomicrobiae bacterium]
MASQNPLIDMYYALAKAKRVLVIGDGKPDGDSMGSSTALYGWLKREGKDVKLFMSVPSPKAFLFLDYVHDFSMDERVFDETWDVVVSLDASAPGAGGFEKLQPHLKPGHLFINVDHHVTNTKFGHLNVVMTDACSTCEIVYRFFEDNHIALDDKMATSLLTGLCTDTSHFTNAGTNVKGIEAAGVCTASGARHADILKHLVSNKTVDGLKLWGLALSRLHENPTYDMTCTFFTLKDIEGVPGGDEAVEGVSNFLNAVCGEADTILVLREKPDATVKGSMRSHTRDVSEVAKKFGGGGHKKAAGFTLPGHIELKNGVAVIVK